MRQRAPSRVVALALVMVLGAGGALRSQSPAADTTRPRAGRVVYQRLPYGSQAYFSPVTVLLNKGFDHFQAKNARRDVWRFPYDRAFRNGVFDAIVNPGRAIEFYPGWNRWLRNEVLPLTYTTEEARWVVNYTEHLLAGGMTYRALDEWFRVRDVPAPALWAALTTFGAGMLNEAVENPDVASASASSVADLLVFDLGGILLFNWDPLVRFFGGTLQGADWSYLATFTAPNGELRNSGQYYILKVPMPWTRTRLFLRGGMGVQAGASRRVRGEHSVTLALGADTEVRNVDPVTRDESIRVKFGGGLYWDRRNSLMASINFSPNADAVKVNVYPGVLPGPGRTLGTWVALTREGHLMGGIVSTRALGLGAGLGW
jgi:hypothetical protein